MRGTTMRYVVLAAALALTAGPVPAFDEGLSLSGALELALEDNPAMLAAAAGVDEGEAGVTEARAPLLPRLDYAESFTRSNNPVFVFGTLLNQRRFTEESFALDALNRPDPLSLYQSRFTLRQTLFAGGRNYLELDRAELARDQAEEGRREAEMRVIAGVVQAYYGVQVTEANLEVVSAVRDVAVEDVRRAEALRAAGMATDADVLSLRVRLADLEEQRIAAESAVEIQRAELNDALGQPLDRRYTLLTPLAEASELAAPPPPAAELESTALARRPDARRTALDVEAASVARRQAKSAFLPSVNLHGGWESDRVSFTGSGGTNWILGVSLQLNLFNGLADRARWRRAVAGMERAEAGRRETENRVRLEVRRARVELDAAGKRFAVAEGAVAQARESHRITQARYEGGLATVTDLLTSQSALLESEARRLAALYGAKLAEVGLELATGTLNRTSEVSR